MVKLQNPRLGVLEFLWGLLKRLEVPNHVLDSVYQKVSVYIHQYASKDYLILIYEEDPYLELILKAKFFEIENFVHDEYQGVYDVILVRYSPQDHVSIHNLTSFQLGGIVSQWSNQHQKKCLTSSDESATVVLEKEGGDWEVFQKRAFLHSDAIQEQLKDLFMWLKNPIEQNTHAGGVYFIETKDFEDQKVLFDYIYETGVAQWGGLDLIRINGRDLVKQLLSSLRTGRLESFLEYFSTCRLLLIEEYDVFRGKPFCQEQLWVIMRLVRDKARGVVVLGFNAQQVAFRFEFEPLKRLLVGAKQISTVQLSDSDRLQMMSLFYQLNGQDTSSIDKLKSYVLRKPYLNYKTFLSLEPCEDIENVSNHLSNESLTQQISLPKWIDDYLTRMNILPLAKTKLSLYLEVLIYKSYYQLTLRQMATIMDRSSHSGLAYLTSQAQKRLKEHVEFRELYEEMIEKLKQEGHMIYVGIK